jgi:hypothetical protein
MKISRIFANFKPGVLLMLLGYGWLLSACQSTPSNALHSATAVIPSETQPPKPSVTLTPTPTSETAIWETATAIAWATEQITSLTPVPTEEPLSDFPCFSTPNPLHALEGNVYKNFEYGIAFEYPPYLVDYVNPIGLLGDCGLNVFTYTEGFTITLGNRLTLDGKTIDRSKVSLKAYLDQIVAERTSNPEISILSIDWSYVAGVRSVTISYGWGYSSGMETYFMHGKMVYALIFSPLGDNTVAVQEYEAFVRIRDTFQFLK